MNSGEGTAYFFWQGQKMQSIRDAVIEKMASDNKYINLTYKEAVQLLTGASVGTFLFRPSSSNSNCLVWMIKLPKKIYHEKIAIVKAENSTYHFTVGKNDTNHIPVVYESLDEIVEKVIRPFFKKLNIKNATLVSLHVADETVQAKTGAKIDERVQLLSNKKIQNENIVDSPGCFCSVM